MACLYWITDNVNENILEYGYVGITSKEIGQRIASHKQSYRRFTKDGVTGGCVKLYNKILKHGGWDKFEVLVLCLADIDYCMFMENKLRPLPNIGLNIRIGGDVAPMLGRKLSEATKMKLLEVRKSWVMSNETRARMSEDRKGEGNPMYGVKPWDNGAATEHSKLSWLYANDVYTHWVKTNHGVKKTHPLFSSLNFNTITTMILKFKAGWIPEKDLDWCSYKDNYDQQTKTKT